MSCRYDAPNGRARWMFLRGGLAEDPQAQEGGLRQEGLDGQGSAENAADEAEY